MDSSSHVLPGEDLDNDAAEVKKCYQILLLGRLAQNGVSAIGHLLLLLCWRGLSNINYHFCYRVTERASSPMQLNSIINKAICKHMGDANDDGN